MGAWGANTFLVRKQLLNPHFQNPQTFVFLVFLTFSSNKRWWWLRAFSFLGRCTRESHVALLPKGRLRQLATPLETFFRELGHLIYVHFYHDSLFCLFPFPSFMFLYSCNSFDAFVFCIGFYLIYALINIFLFDAHTTPTLFCTHVSY